MSRPLTTIRLLGPVTVEVTGLGRPDLGPPKQRAVLAVLALSTGAVVSTDHLVAAVWDDPPPSAAAVLQTYVSALRRILEPTRRRDEPFELLLTRRPGYLLDLPTDAVDANRFTEAAAAGRAALASGDASRAAHLLAEALAEWRGAALADLGDVPVARTAGAALDRARLDVVEDRLDAMLALGEHASLVPELEGLVDAHPLRERLRAQLVLALYRAGRQADALRVYEHGRLLLAEELGVDPAPALQRLFTQVLRHDPLLQVPAPVTTADPAGSRESEGRTTAPSEEPPASPSRTRARSRPPPRATPTAAGSARSTTPSQRSGPARRRTTAAAAAVVLVLSAAVVAGVRGGGPAGAQELSPGAIGPVDLDRGEVRHEVVLGERAGAVVVVDDRLWATLPGRGALVSSDANRPSTVREVTLEPGLGGAAAQGGAVWVTSSNDRTLVRVDARSGRVAQRVPVGGRPGAVAAAGGSLWVANRLDDTVTQVDGVSGAVLGTVAVGRDPVAVAGGDDAVWVASAGDATLTRIGLPDARVVQRFRLAGSPSGVLAAHGLVWVSDATAGTVTRVDALTGRVVGAVPVFPGVAQLARLQDAVVASSAYDGRLAVLDPRSGALRRSVTIASAPLAVHSDGRRLWAAAATPPAQGRGGTLRVASPGPVESPDPAETYTTGASLVTALTHDGLVSMRRAGGVDGTQVVADLALDVPTPTDGGTTWTFRLRPDVRYSTGGTVRPSDVRASFERLLRNSAPYYEAITGASECSPTACDLSSGIVVDDAGGTVTFRLSRPDPDFLAKLALPLASVLPADAPAPVPPDRAAGVDWSRLAATGPYRALRVEGSTVVLVRNEVFSSWSPEAVPDALADRIEVRYDADPRTAVDDVLRGRLDLLLDPPAEDVDTLAARFPTQLMRFDEPATSRLLLNTRRPPFDALLARRAVATAVDRAAVARRLGGDVLAVASCQILPPVVVGYAPFCPFGTGPGATAPAPDVDAARELVRQSGTSGAKVRLLAPERRVDAARTLEQTLDAIGYSADLEVVVDDYFQVVADTRTTPEAHVAGWYAETASASSFAMLTRCAAHVPEADNNTNLNVSGYCDATAESLVEEALRVQQDDPSRSAAAWAAVDRHLTQTVAWVPLASLQRAVLVSPRVQGLVYVPSQGPALDRIVMSPRG